MTKKTNKKTNKQSYFLFFAVFIIIFILILIPRSNQGQILSIPQNKGFTELYNIDDTLIAQEVGGTFYLFDWSNITADPVTFPTASDKAVLLNGPALMSLSVSPAGKVVVLDQGGITTFQQLLGVDAENILVVTNENRSEVVVMAVVRLQETCTLELYNLDISRMQLSRCCSFEINVGSRINAAVLSQDANELVMIGDQNGKAYIASMELSSRNIKWEKQFSDLTSFFSIAYSNKYLFVGSEDGTVSKLDPQTGKESNRRILVEKARENTNFKRIYKTVLSPHDKWLACSCDPEVFLLNPETLEIEGKYGVPHKIVAGVVFSPDETKVATSDLRADGIIEIREIMNELAP